MKWEKTAQRNRVTKKIVKISSQMPITEDITLDILGYRRGEEVHGKESFRRDSISYPKVQRNNNKERESYVKTKYQNKKI